VTRDQHPAARPPSSPASRPLAASAGPGRCRGPTRGCIRMAPLPVKLGPARPPRAAARDGGSGPSAAPALRAEHAPGRRAAASAQQGQRPRRRRTRGGEVAAVRSTAAAATAASDAGGGRSGSPPKSRADAARSRLRRTDPCRRLSRLGGGGDSDNSKFPTVSDAANQVLPRADSEQSRPPASRSRSKRRKVKSAGCQ
jgi:hypothetical protein